MPFYSDRITRLRNRRTDTSSMFAKVRQANEVYERIRESEAVRFLIGAMQPIDSEYTDDTYSEANRIREQLDANYSVNMIEASFDFQGSVTNNTHIKAFSDIDLLAVNEKFVDVETVHLWTSIYQGNPIAEMRHLRSTSVRILRDRFPAARVDDSHSRAVKIEGGSLKRKIDLVLCNWWDTDNYIRSRDRSDRGIMVFDKDTAERVPNKPFLHNALIDSKDKSVNGNLRKVIRLLKSLRYDANETAGYEKVSISSYDICALCYVMPRSSLIAKPDEDLKLAVHAGAYLSELEKAPYRRALLKVPNETRAIFCDEGATEEGLRALSNELQKLLDEIENDTSRSFRKLAEARIAY